MHTHNLCVSAYASAGVHQLSTTLIHVFLMCGIYMVHGTMSVAGGDGELGCLCGKAGTSHLCDGSAHSSGCVVNGSNAMSGENVYLEMQVYFWATH